MTLLSLSLIGPPEQLSRPPDEGSSVLLLCPRVCLGQQAKEDIILLHE
jgi:hypothetical protein